MEFNVGIAEDAEIRYDLQAAPPTNYEDPKKNLYIDKERIPVTKYILFKSKRDIENPYFVVSASDYIILFRLYLFEAYTKGYIFLLFRMSAVPRRSPKIDTLDGFSDI